MSVYREVLGSDVVSDGMYIELRNAADEVAATVFLSDIDGRYEITRGPADAPEEVVRAFIDRAKAVLAARNK